jgi:death-on-curing protein
VASDYLTVVEVLAIHDVMMSEFGGATEIRDMGALEAAIFRPQTGYYDGALAEAAAVMESLVQGHPFVDGNKRTAVAAADLHLRLNGRYLAADPGDIVEFVIDGLADGTLDHTAIDGFLREHSKPL